MRISPSKNPIAAESLRGHVPVSSGTKSPAPGGYQAVSQAPFRCRASSDCSFIGSSPSMRLHCKSRQRLLRASRWWISLFSRVCTRCTFHTLAEGQNRARGPLLGVVATVSSCYGRGTGVLSKRPRLTAALGAPSLRQRPCRPWERRRASKLPPRAGSAAAPPMTTTCTRFWSFPSLWWPRPSLASGCPSLYTALCAPATPTTTDT